MNEQKSLRADRITKPIQLLAAWLIGLVLVNGSFLTTASVIETPVWAKGLLIIAAIVNVPIFLFSIFVLQTKFRPEMQEDSFYHEYLVNKLGQRPKDKSIEKSASIAPVETGEWEGFKILVNRNLNGCVNTERVFKQNHIPISGTFGESSGKPPSKTATIGSGFSINGIRKVIKALSETEIEWINFGQDEDTVNQYDDTLLVGSYVPNPETESISIEDAQKILQLRDLTSQDFYQHLFDAMFENEA